MPNRSIQIVVNGESREVPESTTVAELLVRMELDNRHLAVECNQELVPRGEHANTTLAAGDKLEVVTLVGGG